MCKLVCHFRNSTTEINLSLPVKSTFSYSEDIYHNIYLCTDRSEKKTILGKHLNRFIKCYKSLLFIQSFRVNIPISVAYKYSVHYAGGTADNTQKHTIRQPKWKNLGICILHSTLILINESNKSNNNNKINKY